MEERVAAHTLWVGNIPSALIKEGSTEAELQRIFSVYGTVIGQSVREKGGLDKSWAFVTFNDEVSVQRALAATPVATDSSGVATTLSVRLADVETHGLYTGDSAPSPVQPQGALASMWQTQSLQVGATFEVEDEDPGDHEVRAGGGGGQSGQQGPGGLTRLGSQAAASPGATFDVDIGSGSKKDPPPPRKPKFCSPHNERLRPLIAAVLLCWLTSWVTLAISHHEEEDQPPQPQPQPQQSGLSWQNGDQTTQAPPPPAVPPPPPSVSLGATPPPPPPPGVPAAPAPPTTYTPAPTEPPPLDTSTLICWDVEMQDGFGDGWNENALFVQDDQGLFSSLFSLLFVGQCWLPNVLS